MQIQRDEHGRRSFREQRQHIEPRCIAQADVDERHIERVDRKRSLRASYDRIEGSPDLLRPIMAAKDVAGDETGPRRQIAETVFDSFAPQLDLSFAAAVYGLAGLFLGSLSGPARRSSPTHCSRQRCKVRALSPICEHTADWRAPDQRRKRPARLRARSRCACQPVRARARR